MELIKICTEAQKDTVYSNSFMKHINIDYGAHKDKLGQFHKAH